jgi:hypothetical protein
MRRKGKKERRRKHERGRKIEGREREEVNVYHLSAGCCGHER